MKLYKDSFAAFHIGRGGKNFQPGHIEYRGPNNICYYLGSNKIFPPESAEDPAAEWTDCDGNGVELTNAMTCTGIGRINIDGQFDTTYTMRVGEIVPNSPEWEALLRAGTPEAYETMYTALNPSDNRTLATLGEFLMAVPEAWGPGLWAFIKDFCTDMGWSWIEPGEEPSACDIVPICTDEEWTLYVEIGPWEEPISYTII